MTRTPFKFTPALLLTSTFPQLLLM